MTPWRAGLLWKLYVTTYQELTRELAAITTPVLQIQGRAGNRQAPHHVPSVSLT